MVLRRIAETGMVAAIAGVITLVIGAPVLLAPSDRVFGLEIVGRHHDPFTVMSQFRRPLGAHVYSQPVTDVAGVLLARVSGPVAAYNWLVLLSFPLSAAAAYLLARRVKLSVAAAALAAMAYAFSPFHLAQAAYHPHIAQTQWIPLYLLALWWCLDKASASAVCLLGAATLAVTFSNFYAGFIAAVVTPAAVAAYSLVTRRAGPTPWRRLGVTAGALVVFAAAGMAYASHAMRDAIPGSRTFAFPREDLFLYSASWWSYLVPPVGHPWLGALAQRVWAASDAGKGLLEQQVYVGWAVLTLALIAIVFVARERGAALRPYVPVLLIVGAVAFLCSLSPQWTIGPFTLPRPSALLYDATPMFRSYARFGVVVQLMAVLLAGIGVDALWRAGTRRARIACMTLVALAAGEYAVAPSTLWRDVLPTRAHRWITQQPGRVQAFDCAPRSAETESVAWMSQHRVTMADEKTDCTEPGLAETLAAGGYTHLLVRRHTPDGRWFAGRAVGGGLELAASFDDGQVFALTAQRPAVHTVAMIGFFPREHDAERSWRWMGRDAAWTVSNTSAWSVDATLSVELAAFHHPRQMQLRLDGFVVATIDVATSRRFYEVGPMTLGPGLHLLVFHPAELPTVAADAIHNGDRRPLSFSLGGWRWHRRAPSAAAVSGNPRR